MSECDYPGCDEKWVLEFPASSATPPDDGWVLFDTQTAHVLTPRTRDRRAFTLTGVIADYSPLDMGVAVTLTCMTCGRPRAYRMFASMAALMRSRGGPV